MATAETEPTTTKALTDAEEGKIAFDFIQATANKLAVTPRFYLALVRDFFDANEQRYPRHYGTNVDINRRFVYHLVAFPSQIRLEAPVKHASLEISKYDLREPDHDRAFLGKIHAYTSWTQAGDDKVFRWGGATYEEPSNRNPGIENIELALSKGEILLADLLNPVNF